MGGVALGPVLESAKAESGMQLEIAFRELPGRTFSELLLPAISELLDDAGIRLSQLAGIVVVHGPGSFTGIRIGVSAAKGLAEALEIPLMAVSRLELLARQAGRTSAVAILDAGRSELYVGVYREVDEDRLTCETELLVTTPELPRVVADSGLPVVVCEEKLAPLLAVFNARMVAVPTAVQALAAGRGRFQRGSFHDVATLDANYLRRSEAELLERIAQHAAQRR